jgi:hypothetical protein
MNKQKKDSKQGLVLQMGVGRGANFSPYIKKFLEEQIAFL